MHIHCQNFISIEVAVQELGGLTQPPLGQGVGKKHVGRERVNSVMSEIDKNVRQCTLAFKRKEVGGLSYDYIQTH